MLAPHSTGSYVHPDDPGEPTTDKPRLSVTDQEAAILAALVNGRNVVEIGTGLGVSTRALASTARTVVTIDVDAWVQANIWPDLPDNVWCNTSPHDVGPIDTAFIDGAHDEASVARDLEAVLALGAELVIAHDTNADEVRKGLGTNLRHWHLIPTTHGIGVHWVQ